MRVFRPKRFIFSVSRWKKPIFWSSTAWMNFRQVRSTAGATARRAISRRPVIRLSAKTGSGFGDLELMLEQAGDFGRRVLNLDYDQYAAGEAALGWLNGTILVKAK